MNQLRSERAEGHTSSWFWKPRLARAQGKFTVMKIYDPKVHFSGEIFVADPRMDPR